MDTILEGTGTIMSMQKKVVTAIKQVITDAGFEVSDEWDFANMGTIHASRPGSFQIPFSVHLDFQSGYMGATITLEGETLRNESQQRADTRFGHARKFYHMEYAKPGEIQSILDTIRNVAVHFAPRTSTESKAKRGPSLDEAYGEALVDHGSHEVADALVEFLKTQPEEVRAAAVKALAELSPAAGPKP